MQISLEMVLVPTTRLTEGPLRRLESI